MELREYIKIIRTNIVLFLVVTFIVVAAVLSFFKFQPEKYSASVLLNITRQGKDDSADYKYDDFYRLQADERFSDTVVEWLKSSRIQADILESAGVSSRSAVKFKPQRRSSQVIFADFKASDRVSAEKISLAIPEIISFNIEELNKNQKEENWFMVMAPEPVIEKYQPPYLKIFLASSFAGLFIAFWAVMIKHYIS
jgi:capsular polysaccharide biosynthesis protein